MQSLLDFKLSVTVGVITEFVVRSIGDHTWT